MSVDTPIRLFRTALHPCGYWPGRQAQDLVLDPDDPALARVYGSALAQGFRRSGGHVYRPRCPGCMACVPVRVPVARFAPDRSQRRCARRNADLHWNLAPARRSDEHFALYRRYLEARHRGGGMDDPTPTEFDAFLACTWSPTRFLEFRTGNGRLLAVAVTDVLPQGLSAVYTFYDPDEGARGLGTLAILRQIEWARHAGLPHVYLGFWLEDHPKMAYKARFQPLEAYDGREWHPMPEPV